MKRVRQYSIATNGLITAEGLSEEDVSAALNQEVEVESWQKIGSNLYSVELRPEMSRDQLEVMIERLQRQGLWFEVSANHILL